MRLVLVAFLALLLNNPALANSGHTHQAEHPRSNSQSEAQERREPASQTSLRTQEELNYKENYRPETLRAKENLSEQEDDKQNEANSKRDDQMFGRALSH